MAMAAVVEFKPSTPGPRKDLYAVGEISAARPCAGENARLGHPQGAPRSPESSMQIEVVPTWPIADDEVLVLVMAGGVNYNGIWAGLASRVSPFNIHKAEYHIAGSDASGVVWAIGSKVKRWKVGGRGHRPLQSGRRRRRGLQRRRPDAFALAAYLGLRDAGRLVRAILPRAVAAIDGKAETPHLGKSACYTLTLATAYRMLFGHPPHTPEARRLRSGLGRSGGLGVFGVQLAARVGRECDRRDLR
jgi:crotonyl-CoA carboxylase/reductase